MAINSKFNIPDTRELFKSLKNVRAEWKLKTPMQKWCYFYGIGRAAYGFLRMSLMNDVNHIHWFGYFAIVYVFGVPLLSLYTMGYYAYHKQLQMGLPSTCVAFVCIGHFPLATKIVFNERFKLQWLVDFGGRYIYHDSHEQTEYNRICSHYMDRTMKLFFIKMGSIAFSFIIAIIGPAHAYLTNGIRTTFIEAHIPFTEPKSNAEFVGNFLIQSLESLHGLITYIGLECFLSIMENVVTVTPALIESDLAHTIQQYEKKSITEAELHLKIGNIVKQSNDVDDYVDSLSKLFHWRNLFNTTAFTYVIGMAIFCQFAMGFAAGYGWACMTWIQLFFVCEVGESIQDNGFVEMLYQTKWEVLPVKMQKVVMLLIHRKQNEEGLSLGPFGMGINRETFKLATNKIYTFVMFLKNFFQ